MEERALVVKPPGIARRTAAALIEKAEALIEKENPLGEWPEVPTKVPAPLSKSLHRPKSKDYVPTPSSQHDPAIFPSVPENGPTISIIETLRGSVLLPLDGLRPKDEETPPPAPETRVQPEPVYLSETDKPEGTRDVEAFLKEQQDKLWRMYG